MQPRLPVEEPKGRREQDNQDRREQYGEKPHLPLVRRGISFSAQGGRITGQALQDK
jgi:hypothetical protein